MSLPAHIKLCPRCGDHFSGRECPRCFTTTAKVGAIQQIGPTQPPIHLTVSATEDAICVTATPVMGKPIKQEANDHHPDPKIPHPEPIQRPTALARNRGGEAPRTGRPCVSFTLRRVKLLDVDAKYGSCKALIDGLATAGLIPGDREDQITLEVTQEKVAHYAEEETVISITYDDQARAALETLNPNQP